MPSADCKRLEALSARGEADFNVELYGQMCDRLGRLFQWHSKFPSEFASIAPTIVNCCQAGLRSITATRTNGMCASN
jgi:hypothetical protein